MKTEKTSLFKWVRPFLQKPKVFAKKA